MKTVGKALEILDFFTDDEPELTLTEIVNRTGFSKTATHRLLQTLLSYNYLSRLPNNSSYRLGPKLFELGSRFVNQNNLVQVARPYLQKVAQKTGDTAFLCVCENYKSLCLERVEGSNPVRTVFQGKGGRLPLHTGSAPIALLAGMSDDEIFKVINKKGFERFTNNTIQDMQQLMKKVRKIRQDGYAISWEDLVIGIASVGAPIRDNSKNVVATISVAGIIQGFGPDRIKKIIDIVTSSAHSISRDMGCLFD